MLHTGFNIRKAAQVVAFFARAAGGSINVLKLVKIVYLSDRHSMEAYDAPILYDHMVSMAHGPVNSATLDLINGMDDGSDDWRSFVGLRRGHDVTIAKEFADRDFDALSRRDLAVLARVWQQFGMMSQYEVRDHTHRFCPEWEDPHGSSNPIPYDRIFKFLGKRDSNRLAEDVRVKQGFDILFEDLAGERLPELDAV